MITTSEHLVPDLTGAPPVRHAMSAAAVAAAALTACGAPPAAPPAAPPVAETVTVPPRSPDIITYPPTVAPPVTQTAASWTMPNLVGTGLQEAQDAIQELTGFGIAVTTSHDATGADRMQVSDRNWKVCTQNVPPGATINRETRIDFGAVKLEESC
jgi:hypothetical protein